MTDFRSYIRSKGQEFPVARNFFVEEMKSWLATVGGKYFMHVGFERNSVTGSVTRMQFGRISVYSQLSKFEAGFTALDTFNQIENLVADQNDHAPQLCKSPAFQTSSLWIKMFTEISVNSTN